MANYKVPQDVEADDKLLGPFTFRQFIYLMIVFGMVVLAVALFQIFPLLAAIPIPVGFFFAILALPIKKDQPMETYLAAVISYHLKPKKRFWMAGQSDSTILITAPKKVEASRIRNISEEEAGHRLSFLADIVDTEGRAIKSANSSMRDEFYAEAYNTTDMFDIAGTNNLNHMISREQREHHEEVVNQMRAAIAQSSYNYDSAPETEHKIEALPGEHVIQPITPTSSAIVQPTPTVTPTPQPIVAASQPTTTTQQPVINPAAVAAPAVSTESVVVPPHSDQLANLANNPDFSIKTIQEQAGRIQQRDNEIYISLH